MYIIKASGEKQTFNPNKLASSLKRTGAEPAAVKQTVQTVKKALPANAPTQKVFQLAQRSLYRHQPAAAIRYSLKQSLYELGPTGFPFEQYMAKILQAHGYETKTNQIIRGRCVGHEVDVLARRDGQAYFIECKHHHSGGGTADVKVILYTHARFLDLKNSLEYWQDEKHGWLITNTKATTECIAYAECVGMRLTAWRYPQHGSLEEVIESNGLYPVTIFPGLRWEEKERLLQNKFVLAKDILDKKNSLSKTRLPRKTLDRLVQQATLLFQ